MDNLPQSAWEPVTPWGVAAFLARESGAAADCSIDRRADRMRVGPLAAERRLFSNVSKALEKLPDKGRDSVW
jgi:hypothetical protein